MIYKTLHRKLKIEQHGPHLKPWMNSLRWSRRRSSSCFVLGNRRITLVINPVISHLLGNRVLFTLLFWRPACDNMRKSSRTFSCYSYFRRKALLAFCSKKIFTLKITAFISRNYLLLVYGNIYNYSQKILVFALKKTTSAICLRKLRSRSRYYYQSLVFTNFMVG